MCDPGTSIIIKMLIFKDLNYGYGKMMVNSIQEMNVIFLSNITSLLMPLNDIT